jgi:hypothetical protein
VVEVLYLRAQQRLVNGQPFTAAAIAFRAICETCDRRGGMTPDPDVLYAPLRLAMDAAQAVPQEDPRKAGLAATILDATIRRWPEVGKLAWFQAMRDEVHP